MRDVRVRENLPYRVGRLFRRMARVHNRELKGFGVSAVQAHVLAVLWLEGAMTAGELQGALALGSSTLTGAIDRMEKAGLVKRRPVPGDRRAVRLEPAAWPEDRRMALLRQLQATEAACFEALTAAERRELGRLLDKASDALAKTDPGAADDD